MASDDATALLDEDYCIALNGRAAHERRRSAAFKHLDDLDRQKSFPEKDPAWARCSYDTVGPRGKRVGVKSRRWPFLFGPWGSQRQR